MNNSDQIKAKEYGAAIELPLVKCTPTDVYGVLFVHHPTEESNRDGLLKLQTWILNFAEEQVKPLRESGMFTDEQIEEIKKRHSVISPITLTLYGHWLQAEKFIKMKDSEKERYMLEKLPDRFKARFRGNASCRSARELTAEEGMEKGILDVQQESTRVIDIEQVIKDLQSNTPPDYIQKFLKENNHYGRE